MTPVSDGERNGVDFKRASPDDKLYEIYAEQRAMRREQTQAKWFFGSIGAVIVSAGISFGAWLGYSTITNTANITNLKADQQIHTQSPGHTAQSSTMQEILIKIAVIERSMQENDAKMDQLQESLRARR